MNSVELAFNRMPRVNFLPEDVRQYADMDMALGIGYGQTNSQPYTVQHMLGWLDVQPGQRVLDIGSGSGWTTALLSQLVGSKGKVYAVEVIPELVEMGRSHCKQAGVHNAEFFTAGQTLGLPDYAPYERILVSASATQFPEQLLDQLAAPGKLVIPVQETIYEVEKFPDGTIEQTPHPGYVFVPLVQNPIR